MMKARTKYLLFVSIVHLVTLTLSFFIFRETIILFIASEALILLSVYISWQLYNDLIRPLKTLMQGVDAIKDRDFNVKFLPTGAYEMDQLIAIYNKMMDELRLERTQQQQQHFFLEKLIRTSPTGIIIMDYDQKIQQLNPKAEQLLQVTEKELSGLSVKQLKQPVFQEITNLHSGENKTINPTGMQTLKLQKSHFIDRGFPRYFVMIEELTVEILAAEKKAYGKVIRMMAHEVNNTIGPVNSIMQSTLALYNNQPEIINALEVAIDRNNNLNNFMRNFADVVRLPAPNKTVINLHQLLYNVKQLMQYRTGDKQIDFHFQTGEDPIYIKGDHQQLEQAFINIVKNAMEAISEKGVIIFVVDVSVKQIIFRDTGKGIPEEFAGELFTPFFSTKRDGQGIGLMIIREILNNHNFPFSLQTVSKGVTEFAISFK